MGFRFIRTKLFSSSPKILMTSCDNVIGNCTYSIINHKTACINNIFIEPKFREQRYGSHLLKYTEDMLRISYHKEKCTLLVHELPHDTLQQFFKSNGYHEKQNINMNVKPTNYDTYDDGSNIFTLVPMYKYLNRFDYK